tara:strand:+ start:1789 stop:2349 length:561 start_codon:yes stop_codon:yes gene_type:complete
LHAYPDLTNKSLKNGFDEMSSRINEIRSFEEPPPPEIEMYGTKYVRCEYFPDGQRVYFSILDFALNGPDIGSIIERVDEKHGRCRVKVLQKHYEHGSEVPSFMECEIIKRNKKSKLWVLVKATKLVIEKFGLHQFGIGSTAFALRPDYFIKKKRAMDILGPYNDSCVAFAIVTGIPPAVIVKEDFE